MNPTTLQVHSSLAGVYFVGPTDARADRSMMARLQSSYRGPDFGGLDYLPPDKDNKSVWLLGRFQDTLVDQRVAQAAVDVLAVLRDIEQLLQSGIVNDGNRDVVLTPSPYHDLQLVALHTYRGLIRNVDGGHDAYQQLLAHSRRLPSWHQRRGNILQWYGGGLSRQGEAIAGFSEYVQVEFAANGMQLHAVMRGEPFDAWVEQVTQQVGWRVHFANRS